MKLKQMIQMMVITSLALSLNVYAASTNGDVEAHDEYLECQNPQPHELTSLVGVMWDDDKTVNTSTYGLRPTRDGFIAVCPILLEHGVPQHFLRITAVLNAEENGLPGNAEGKAIVSLPGQDPIELGWAMGGNFESGKTVLRYNVSGLEIALKSAYDSGNTIAGFITIPIATSKLPKNSTITIPFVLSEKAESTIKVGFEFKDDFVNQALAAAAGDSTVSPGHAAPQQADPQPIGACAIGTFPFITCANETWQQCQGIGIWSEGKCPAPDQPSPLFQ